MIINLSDILSGKIKNMEVQVSLDNGSIEINGTVFELTEWNPCKLVFTNQSKGKGVVTASVAATFKTYCDRCLTETDTSLNFDIERDFYSPDIETEDADDYEFMEGFNINTEKLLNEEIFINWPSIILCKDDCLGLCHVCGQNLNIKDCGCDRRVPDVRMAGIMDIFNGER